MILFTPLSFTLTIIFFIIYLRKREDHYKYLTMAFFILTIVLFILRELLFRWMLS